MVLISCERENFSDSQFIEKSAPYLQSFLLKDYQPAFQVVLPRTDSLDPSPVSPPFAILERIIDSMVSLDNRMPYLSNLMDYYGIPAWNYSIMDLGSITSDYIVSVPFVKDEKVIAILTFHDHGVDVHFKLFSRAKADSVVFQPPEMVDKNIWFLPVSRRLSQKTLF